MGLSASYSPAIIHHAISTIPLRMDSTEIREDHSKSNTAQYILGMGHALPANHIDILTQMYPIIHATHTIVKPTIYMIAAIIVSLPLELTLSIRGLALQIIVKHTTQMGPV